MAIIRKIRGHEPVVGENTFLAETAVLLGDVTVGHDCSIWYGAVLRGDVNRIVVGNRTNIQDGAVLHALYDRSPRPSETIIGSDMVTSSRLTGIVPILFSVGGTVFCMVNHKSFPVCKSV